MKNIILALIALIIAMFSVLPEITVYADTNKEKINIEKIDTYKIIKSNKENITQNTTLIKIINNRSINNEKIKMIIFNIILYIFSIIGLIIIIKNKKFQDKIWILYLICILILSAILTLSIISINGIFFL